MAYVALSPDGRWLATGVWQSRGVKVWDVAGGKAVKELHPERDITRVAFSPDGQRLLTSTNAEYQFWEVGTWKPHRTISHEAPGLAGPVAFSRDGRMAAISPTRYSVQLIDMATWEPLARLESPAPQHLSCLCFSPDGSLLAAASGSHTIELWDFRVIRQRLAEMGLDWDLPPYPPPPPAVSPSPLSVKVVLKEARP